MLSSVEREQWETSESACRRKSSICCHRYNLVRGGRDTGLANVNEQGLLIRRCHRTRDHAHRTAVLVNYRSANPVVYRVCAERAVSGSMASALFSIGRSCALMLNANIDTQEVLLSTFWAQTNSSIPANSLHSEHSKFVSGNH